jgi:hypothetical protein
MRSASFIVGFKDGPDKRIKYFGPFVSQSIADYFRASLPMPQKGGWCRSRRLEPFSAHDGRKVTELVLSER